MSAAPDSNAVLSVRIAASWPRTSGTGLNACKCLNVDRTFCIVPVRPACKQPRCCSLDVAAGVARSLRLSSKLRLQIGSRSGSGAASGACTALARCKFGALWRLAVTKPVLCAACWSQIRAWEDSRAWMCAGVVHAWYAEKVTMRLTSQSIMSSSAGSSAESSAGTIKLAGGVSWPNSSRVGAGLQEAWLPITQGEGRSRAAGT